MENYNLPNQNKDTSDTAFGLILGGATLLAIIIAFLALNYFNVLSLSELFPSTFGWLPHTQTVSQVKTPATVKQTNPTDTGSGSKFTPSLNAESQKGPLIKSAVVLYTLQGKIIKVTPAESGKYVIELNSSNGAQSYVLPAVGGEGVLKSAKGPDASWSDVKAGDDAIVDLSITSAGQVSVNQITVTNK